MHGVRRTRSSLVSEPYDDDFVALWRVLGADTGVCAVLETWQDEGGIGSCVFKKWVHVRNPERRTPPGNLRWCRIMWETETEVKPGWVLGA